MDILELTCPSCGVKINVSDDATAFNCPHCGCNIILDSSQSMNVNFDQIPNNNSSDHFRTQQKKPHILLMRIAVSILGIVILAGAACFIAEKTIDNRMESTVEEVRGYIDIEEYDRARSALAALEYRGMFSKSQYYWENQQARLSIEIVKKEVRHYIDLGDYLTATTKLESFKPEDLAKEEWEITKDALQREIQQKQEQHEDSIERPMPHSSKDMTGMQYSDVETDLRKAGFTNIVAIKESYKNKWWRKKITEGSVKEIAVENAGKATTSFKEKEVFPAASRITITYYSQD